MRVDPGTLYSVKPVGGATTDGELLKLLGQDDSKWGTQPITTKPDPVTKATASGEVENDTSEMLKSN